MACQCKRQVRRCHVQWFFYRLKMFKRCSGWQQVWSAAHLLRQPPRNAPRRSGRIPQWFWFDTLFKMSFFFSLSRFTLPLLTSFRCYVIGFPYKDVIVEGLAIEDLTSGTQTRLLTSQPTLARSFSRIVSKEISIGSLKRRRENF